MLGIIDASFSMCQEFEFFRLSLNVQAILNEYYHQSFINEEIEL